MRAIAIIIPVLFATLFMGSGCGEPNDPSHVQKLDSLITAMEHAQLRIDSLDMELIGSIGEQFSQQKKFMEVEYRDTLQKDEAIFLGNYFQELKKPLARLLKGEKGINEELKLNIKSLKDLHHDISKGLLSADKESAFYSKEELMSRRSLDHVDEKMRDAKKVKGRWDLEHDQVDILITKFKAEQAKPK